MRLWTYGLLITVGCGVGVGHAVAQDAEAPFSYQVGLEAAEFVKLFEEEDEPYTYTLVARWIRQDRHAVRGGLSYRHSTHETGTLEVGVRVGYDHLFVRDGRWRFYAGADIVLLHEAFSGGDRHTSKAGLSPLMGFMFFISPRFSLATEPRFVALYNRFTDSSTFSLDAPETWYTFALGGIGHLQVNFHF